MSKEILEAVRAIEREKGIEGEALLTALEDALLAAYRKTPDASPFARVEIDRTEGVFRLFQFVGDELPDDALILIDDVDEPETHERESSGYDDEPVEDEIEFSIDWSKVPQEFVESEEVSPETSFGRIAAQTARQVILQRIRDAERGLMYDEYIDRVGDLVTGIVQQSDRRVTLVDLGQAEAILPRSESIPGERFDHGSRIKAVILEVRDNAKGPQIVLSRASDQIIHRLFELEIPEVADGLVRIRSVAREPGFRAKIAVESDQAGVDPVGACVGPRGSRVRMVVSELRGEKIDIIPYNDEPARYIAKALSPARVREVIVDDDNRQATVLVPDDQLALAIGREGQNARLAARLTGWGIDIRSSDEYSGSQMGAGGDEGQASQPAREMLAEQRRKSGPVDVNMYRSLPRREQGDDAVSDGEADPDGEAPAEVDAEAVTEPAEAAGEAADSSEAPEGADATAVVDEASADDADVQSDDESEEPESVTESAPQDDHEPARPGS